jgi:hypothetical protein
VPASDGGAPLTGDKSLRSVEIPPGPRTLAAPAVVGSSVGAGGEARASSFAFSS